MSLSADDAFLDIPAVQAARQALAAEHDLDPGHVQVVAVEEVTWNDSSLGCSRPGEMYLQVLTPGYRVTLEAAGELAIYHTDRSEGGRPPSVVRCEGTLGSRSIQAIEPPKLGVIGAPALDKARRDLEQRAGPDATIVLEETLVADVMDLTCGGADEAEPPSGPGKVIMEFHLRAGDEVHIYRAWGTDDVIYCGTEPDEDPAVE